LVVALVVAEDLDVDAGHADLGVEAVFDEGFEGFAEAAVGGVEGGWQWMSGFFLEASVFTEVIQTRQALGGCWEVQREGEADTLSCFGGMAAIVDFVML
jgi:sulfite reductase beta subunit-like hemoprotein